MNKLRREREDTENEESKQTVEDLDEHPIKMTKKKKVTKGEIPTSTRNNTKKRWYVVKLTFS